MTDNCNMECEDDCSNKLYELISSLLSVDATFLKIRTVLQEQLSHMFGLNNKQGFLNFIQLFKNYPVVDRALCSGTTTKTNTNNEIKNNEIKNNKIKNNNLRKLYTKLHVSLNKQYNEHAIRYQLYHQITLFIFDIYLNYKDTDQKNDDDKSQLIEFKQSFNKD